MLEKLNLSSKSFIEQLDQTAEAAIMVNIDIVVNTIDKQSNSEIKNLC